MDDRYPLSLQFVSCPNLKQLLKYEPEEINKAFNCCGGTRLHHLLSKGLSEEVLQLINRGADVNLIDSDSQTALTVAIMKKSVSPDIVKIIAQKTSDLNIVDRAGKNALHLAVSSANSEAVIILLQLGANIDFQDRLGNSPLHYAFDHSLDLVETLVDNGANVDVKNNNGETPLHTAVGVYQIGRMDVGQLKNIISILLDKGAIINEQTKYGETILHNLGFRGGKHCDNNEIHKFLLHKGAQVHLPDKEGVTPLYLAIKEKAEYLGLMLRTESGKSAVNIPDNQRNYPLFLATKRRDFEMVKLLLDNGALIDVKNKLDETPLYLALKGGDMSESIINLLIDRGAQVSCKDKYMITPLHIACEGSFDQQKLICTTLLTKGASPNVQDETGMTPLHYAVKGYTTNIVQLLLENDAKLNIKNKKGKSPIKYVRKVDTLELLLQKGAEVDEQDNYGRTALHNIASQSSKALSSIEISSMASIFIHRLLQSICESIIIVKGSRKVVKLLEWGASQNIKDNLGKLPFDYFSFNEAQKVYEIKKTCLYSTYQMETDSSNSNKFQKLHERCCVEVDRMKLEILGKNSLYDIFRHYDDQNFLSNGELESAVLSKDLKVKFPVYYSMLTSTYLRSKVRVQLFHHVVDILQTPLPFEVMRYILTFVDDDSLKNVIKAKEEAPDKEKTDTISKSETEPDFELNSENDPDSECDLEFDLDFEPESDWEV